jgi:lysophospholipase L1-like esterase
MWVRSLPASTRRALSAAAAVVLAILVTCARPEGGPAPERHSQAVEPAPSPVRAVFFGSSTTAGSGASRRERRWTSILSRRLGWIEVNRGLSSSTLTALGRNVPSGEERWREALGGAPADLVFVMYGANDVLSRAPLGDRETPGTFRHAAAAVLGGLREALPAALIVVCTPQPSLATAATREPYDLALAEAAASAGALFVAAGSAFPEQRLGALSADRLHLNDAGHAALAEFFLERQALLQPRAAR